MDSTETMVEADNGYIEDIPTNGDRIEADNGFIEKSCQMGNNSFRYLWRNAVIEDCGGFKSFGEHDTSHLSGSASTDLLTNTTGRKVNTCCDIY